MLGVVNAARNQASISSGCGDVATRTRRKGASVWLSGIPGWRRSFSRLIGANSRFVSNGNLSASCRCCSLFSLGQSASQARFRKFPVFFPVSGILKRGDSFASDCVHHQFSPVISSPDPGKRGPRDRGSRRVVRAILAAIFAASLTSARSSACSRGIAIAWVYLFRSLGRPALNHANNDIPHVDHQP